MFFKQSANSAKRAAEQAGDVDLLVNSAGIALLEPFLETSVDKFDLTMNVNVRAAMIISQVVAKNMIKRKSGGSIVNISSQAGEVGFRDHTSYCVSKGALDQLTRTMVSKKRRNCCNCVQFVTVMLCCQII